MREVEKIRSTARTPTYSGTTSSDWSKPSLGDYGYDSVEDMTQEEKTEVAEHSLLGDANADTFDQLQFFPVVEPSSGNLSEGALRAVISGRGSQADISSDAKESAQSKARSLLREEFDMGEEEKQELIDTVKKVRDGELEVSKALDKFIDVDKEVIDEIKEELDKEKDTEEDTEEETEKDKDIEKKIEESVQKIMDEENIEKSKAMVEFLEDNPEIYAEYKQRGG